MATLNIDLLTGNVRLDLFDASGASGQQQVTKVTTAKFTRAANSGTGWSWGSNGVVVSGAQPNGKPVVAWVSGPDFKSLPAAAKPLGDGSVEVEWDRASTPDGDNLVIVLETTGDSWAPPPV